MSDFNYNISTGPISTVNSFPSIVQEVGITTDGYPVQIICTGDASPTSGATWQRLQLYRDGSSIGNILHIESSAAGINATVAMTWIDTPVAGVHTYSLIAINGSNEYIYGEADPVVITVEEKSGIKGLSWIRRDVSPPDVYYGYNSNENANDSDATWSIKKVTTSGTVDTVKWTNGGSNYAISTWDNRIDSFIDPSSITGFTWSLVQFPSNVGINMSWDSIYGVDRFRVIVKNNNIIYSDGGHQIYNNPNLNDDVVTKEVKTNNYYYKFGQLGVTYSVKLIALNVAGLTYAIFDIAV